MEFMIGCNYWASNAGADMWRNWSEEAVRDDLAILKSSGVKYMRMFINWRDFQPVIQAYGGGGILRKYTMEDGSEPSNIWYLDEKCLERFGRFCDICEEYGMKLIVGLITGWMSGKLFIPAALNGKNLYTDPAALFFEQKLIEGTVRMFRNKKAIYAWDLGNECDCLPHVGVCQPSEQAYLTAMWAQLIANAIRAEDNTRPVISGLTEPVDPDRRMAPWDPRLHGQTVDMMTSHPYTYFRPHTGNDYFTSVRTTMHATAVTRYLADISGKPALVEEIGTLGTSLCSDETSAKFMNVNLLSNWVNGNAGLLWWCANEQSSLETAPYTWDMLERELGLIGSDRKPKKYLVKMKEFSDFLIKTDLKLPEACKDVVIVVPSGLNKGDLWGTVYSSYILAKQAKLNPRFAYCEEKLPDSDAYIVPCINASMPPECYFTLRDKVKDGATVFMSNSAGFLQEFAKFTGLEIIDSASSPASVRFGFHGKDFSLLSNKRYITRTCGAEVLAEDENGMPVFTVNRYGKGKVYFLNLPLEEKKANGFDAFSDGSEIFYRTAFEKIIGKHPADTSKSCIALTFHYDPEDKSRVYAAAINHSDETTDPCITLAEGVKVVKTYRGSISETAPFDAFIAELRI